MPVSPHVVTWEAEYEDNKIIAERDGWSYDRLPRDGMRSFALVAPGETLLRLFCEQGRVARDPNTLVYRRRTVMAQSGGGSTVFFLLGFMNGDVFAFYPHDDTVVKGAFRENDAVFNPPQSVGGERWDDWLAHGVDVVARRDTVKVPSGYMLKVPKPT